MSKASITYLPFGTTLVGGAIAMAILDILVKKNVLTFDDGKLQGVLKTAEDSFINSPKVTGSLLTAARISSER